MGQHLKNHGAVHTFWIISILISIIAALIIIVPDGAIIRDYLSFASAISSIILAVIAIFYAIFSNQGFSETVGLLRESVERAESGSRALAKTSTSLETTVSNFTAEIADFRPRFDAIDTKLDHGLALNRAIDAPSEKNSGNKSIVTGDVLTPALAISLYVILQMKKTGRDVNTKDIFPGENWKEYVAGCLSTISYLKPLGIDLIRTGAFSYSLNSIGNMKEEDFSSLFSEEKMNKKMKNIVDKHFAHENIN
jgi:hypothetical protein